MKRWTEEDFRYKIGQKVPGGAIVAYTPLIEGYGKKGKPSYKKAYYIICDTYNKIFKRKQTDIEKSKTSPYVNGQKVCLENSIFTTRPDLRLYFLNKNDLFNYTKGSNKKVLLKCPNCEHIFKSTPNNLTYNGFNCKMCSTGMSVGEKTMLSLAKINEIEVVKEKTFKDLKTNNNKLYRFDFYLPNYNTIIEIHGEQHYKVSDTSPWTKLQITQSRDNIKEKYCKDNKINFIKIDNRNNDIDSVIKGIEKSNISYLFPIRNRNDVIEYTSENLDSYDIKNIIRDFKKGMKYKDMQDKYQVTYGVLSYTLKKYNIHKNRNNYKGKKKVKCLNTGELFSSVKNAQKWALESTNIAMCCRGERKSAGKHPVTGEKLIWEYVDNE